MKHRGLLLGGLAIVILGITFFALRDSPKSVVSTPHEIPKLDGLEKIVIKPAPEAHPPAEGEPPRPPEKTPAPESMTWEKREGEWWIVEPVEAPLSQGLRSQLAELFDDEIGTEDLTLPSEKAKEYGLTPEHATEVALYEKGASKPAVELVVGKEITVPQTRVRRTFVRIGDKDRIYRLQAGLAPLLSRDLTQIRELTINRVKTNELIGIALTHRDGSTFELAKSASDSKQPWKLAQPAGVEMRIEPSRANRMAGTVSNLRAMGFVDGKEAADLDFEKPDVTLKASLKPKPAETVPTQEATEEPDLAEMRILIRPGTTEDSRRYFLKRVDRDIVYELTADHGQLLTSSLDDMRSLVPRPLETDAITRIELSGDDKVVLVKSGADWTMTRPKKEAGLDTNQMTSLLTFLSSFRVGSWAPEELTPAEAGLTASDSPERVVIQAGGDRHVLLIGKKIAPDATDHYGMFEGDQRIFVLPKYTTRRVRQNADSLLTKPS